MNIITGEKFQYLTDIYIGNTEFDKGSHIYNKTIDVDKCFRLDKISNHPKLLSANIIFVYTHILNKNTFPQLLNILKRKKNEFILLFHNSDSSIDEKFTQILDTTKCKKIFAQNVSIYHNKIQYIPIGIANSKWEHGNLNLLSKIIKQDIKKTNNIFFNFSIGTNYNARKRCYDVYNNVLTFSKFKNQEKYLTELKKCKFCICPRGNGLDSHRIWECFYLDVIPICEKSIFTENINRDFPIHLLDNWNNLQINEDLYVKYDTYISKLDRKKLNFNFWKDKIMNME